MNACLLTAATFGTQRQPVDANAHTFLSALAGMRVIKLYWTVATLLFLYWTAQKPYEQRQR